MRRLALAAAFVAVGIATPLGVACGTLESSNDAPRATSDGGDEASPDASPPPPPVVDGGCDPEAPFTRIDDLVELNDPDASTISTPRLTRDELHVFFEALHADFDVWTADRDSITSTFHDVRRVSGVATAGGTEAQPTVDAVANEIFFMHVADSGLDEIRHATRLPAGGFGPPTTISDATTSNHSPFLLESPRQLWFTRDTQGVARMWVVADTGGGFGQPVAFDTGIDAGIAEDFPVLSADGTTLYFTVIDGGKGVIYRARRPTVTAPFGAAAPVSELQALAPTTAQLPGWISPDHCRLYLSITKTIATFKIAVARR